MENEGRMEKVDWLGFLMFRGYFGNTGRSQCRLSGDKLPQSASSIIPELQYRESRIDDYIACCPNPSVFIDEHGIMVCSSCGEVFGPEICEQDRRAFNNEEKKERVHHEIVNSYLGYRTTFNGMNTHYRRLKRINDSWFSNTNRVLKPAWAILKNLECVMGVNRYVFDIAFKIEKAFLERRETHSFLRGCPTSAFCCAAMFLSYRVNECPRSINEMLEASKNAGLGSISHHFLVHCISLLKQHVLPTLYLTCGSPSDLVKNYILNTGERLRLSVKDQLEAIQIHEQACKYGLKVPGRSPAGFAAAALYFATQGLTQQQAAVAFHITEMTLRKRVKELREILDIERDRCKRHRASIGKE